MNYSPNIGIYKVYNTLLKINGLDGAEIRTLMSQVNKLPETLFQNCQTIFIFNSNDPQPEFNSSYSYGTITINLNTVKNKNNLIKLITHELFHSLEEIIKDQQGPYFGVYQSVEREYKFKRKKLLNTLNSDPNVKNKPHPKFWNTIEFSNEFDSYLYHDVTYPVLQFKIKDYFPSPYAATSISEYMSVGMEIFLFEDSNWLKVFCPELYRLILKVIWKK